MKVLGTAFNINAYPDELLLATTLVNGSVKVTANNRSVIIKPAEQVVFNYESADLKTIIPSMEEVLAWKEGRFEFRKADIKHIMRQISRWYDVEVIYDGNIPATQFSGSLLRTQNPSGLLHAFELTDDIHFVMEERKIKVIAGKKPKQ